jgi:putative phosphoesterase
MKRIGLLADTHNYLDDQIFRHFEECDEIWHAGDFGSMEIAGRLNEFRPLKGVYGNIDDKGIRANYPEKLRWSCEAVDVLMIHIGGYPPKYNPGVKKILMDSPPQLFICGHSHLLKIMYDDKLSCLHMNPGAAGKQGWHKVRTVIRFMVDGKEMKDCEVIELGKR